MNTDKEIKKIQNKIKRKVSKKIIKKIGVNEFRLLNRMITIFESRYAYQFKFSQKQYTDFLNKTSISNNVIKMLSHYLEHKDKYYFPTLTLRIKQIRGGKLEYSNITFKKIERKK